MDYRVHKEKGKIINIMKKYGTKATKKIKNVMHEFGEGKLKIGKSNKKVKNRKQAVAIGISQARKKGYKVPKGKNKRS